MIGDNGGMVLDAALLDDTHLRSSTSVAPVAPCPHVT